MELNASNIHEPVVEPMMSDISRQLMTLRTQHPAWLLLASRRGPLILASLQSLIDAHPGGIDFNDAVEHLTDLFAQNANDPNLELGDDHSISARRELQQWIKRRLIVERDGQLMATDALQRAILFLESLEDQPMTSTASRLATVQQAIETLELQLSQSQSGREHSLKRRIQLLENELASVQAGKFEVLSGVQAEEGIREVYQLAISLRADFRRVEDSYREADRELRKRIISENQSRGEIVDELLDDHEELVSTIEGQVFQSFYQQLVKTAELEQMKSRLRSILENASSQTALDRKQKRDLRTLVPRLVRESKRVIQARARSERDVRGFLKSGLANEQIKVGAILHEILQAALEVDWQSQNVRRKPSPLPPVAFSVPNLPVVERLLIKQVDERANEDLDLTLSEADSEQMDEEFWRAYHALDREELFKATLQQLRNSEQPQSIRALAQALPPTHDLESLAYWLTMAREAGMELYDQAEVIDLFDDDEGWIRFFVPLVEISHAAVEDLEPGSLE